MIIKTSRYNYLSKVQIHESISTLSDNINGFTAQLGQDPFIQSLGFSGANSNSDIDFSLPQLQFWVGSNVQEIKQSFTHWEPLLLPLKTICHNFLMVVKESAVHEEVHVHQGVHQCSFPLGSTCHMIILTCCNEIVPQTQYAHNRLNISIHHPTTLNKLVDGSTHIQLGLCTL